MNKYLAIYFQVFAYEEPQMNANKRRCLSPADSSAVYESCFPRKKSRKIFGRVLRMTGSQVSQSQSSETGAVSTGQSPPAAYFRHQPSLSIQMVNIDKHISHWQSGAEEDFEVADQLIRSGKIRHGLFFLHLTLEKILKAHVCRNSGDIAPRLHNLVRLAELSEITFRQEHADFLAEMNPLNIEGRYPEIWGPVPSREEADMLLQKTGGIFGWLKNQL